GAARERSYGGSRVPIRYMTGWYSETARPRMSPGWCGKPPSTSRTFAGRKRRMISFRPAHGLRFDHPPRSSKDRLQMCPDGLGDDAMAFGVGVNSVGEVQRRLARDIRQKKRNEYGVVLTRERGEEVAKVPGVGLPHVGRDLHAGDDDAGLRIVCADGVDDGLQVRANLRDRHAAEAVVGAKFEYKYVDRFVHEPGDPA